MLPILVDGCRQVLSSTFDDRPSNLFDRIHHARIAIILAERGVPPGELFVASYMKWYRDARSTLFDRVSYVRDREIARKLDVFPKYGHLIEAVLVEKLIEQTTPFATLISRDETEHKIYYKITGVGHWFNINTRAPRFFRAGVDSSSTREESISFADESVRDLAFTILNSSLFYWFDQLRTNCRDFNPSDIKTFPLPSSLLTADFRELANKLRARLDESSSFTTMTSKKTGLVRVETFRPHNAKSVIDHIDTRIAPHFGFTSDQLDFIINYDVKYRLGADANGD